MGAPATPTGFLLSNAVVFYRFEETTGRRGTPTNVSVTQVSGHYSTNDRRARSSLGWRIGLLSWGPQVRVLSGAPNPPIFRFFSSASANSGVVQVEGAPVTLQLIEILLAFDSEHELIINS